MKVLRV